MTDRPVELPEHDFGFSTTDANVPMTLVKSDVRFDEIKKLVLPLIDNLMKDPEKDIHWPGRDKKLRDFKKKLLKLCGN
jgi:hypothetical protein